MALEEESKVMYPLPVKMLRLEIAARLISNWYRDGASSNYKEIQLNCGYALSIADALILEAAKRG